MPKMPGKDSVIVVHGPISIPEFIDIKTQILSLSETSFITPLPRITDSDSLNKWPNSPAFHKLIQFIQRLNKAVINRKIGDTIHVSLVMILLIKESLNLLEH